MAINSRSPRQASFCRWLPLLLSWLLLPQKADLAPQPWKLQSNQDADEERARHSAEEGLIYHRAESFPSVGVGGKGRITARASSDDSFTSCKKYMCLGLQDSILEQQQPCLDATQCYDFFRYLLNI